MKSKRKYQQIEQRYGKPMRDVLIDLYEKHGSQILVARELGVSQGTVALWLLKNALQPRTILVPRQFPEEGKSA